MFLASPSSQALSSCRASIHPEGVGSSERIPLRSIQAPHRPDLDVFSSTQRPQYCRLFVATLSISGTRPEQRTNKKPKKTLMIAVIVGFRFDVESSPTDPWFSNLGALSVLLPTSP